MIDLCLSLSNIDAVAVSGGVDSMALLSFMRRKNPIVVHFNHRTEHARDADAFVSDYCYENKLRLITSGTQRPKYKSESWEEYWRNERYAFFNSLPFNIATAHHLDDVAEGFMMGCIQAGYPRFPRKHLKPNVYRPLLLTPKSELISWCDRKNVSYIVDPSNGDTKYKRNKVRKELMPKVMEINPGLLKTVRRAFRNQEEN